MIEITLTRGQVALIDDEDHDIVRLHRWTAVQNGYKHKLWYARAKNGNGGSIYMHRLITGAPNGHKVDHVNGNSLDNRRENLRFCDDAMNQWNRKAVLSASGYKGVSKTSSGKWLARIAHRGETLCLGTYERAEDAALAYDFKAIELRPKFAATNFPRSILGRLRFCKCKG